MSAEQAGAPAPMSAPPLRAVKAGVAYFGLVFGAGFVLGAIRVPFLVPRLGERYAELAEMPLMFVVILFAARYVAKRFALPPTAPMRLGVGLLALALLLAALALCYAFRAFPVWKASLRPVPVSSNERLPMLEEAASSSLDPDLVRRSILHAVGSPAAPDEARLKELERQEEEAE